MSRRFFKYFKQQRKSYNYMYFITVLPPLINVPKLQFLHHYLLVYQLCYWCMAVCVVYIYVIDRTFVSLVKKLCLLSWINYHPNCTYSV